MSKIAQITKLIAGSHVMGRDTLADYHAARLARDAFRRHAPNERFAAIRAALKNHRVMVSIMGDRIRIFRPDTGTDWIL